MLDDEVVVDVKAQVVLTMISRHGLIAGATGTGKTPTLKVKGASSRMPGCRSSSATSRAMSRASPRGDADPADRHEDRHIEGGRGSDPRVSGTLFGKH
jgi:hypothetical protein